MTGKRRAMDNKCRKCDKAKCKDRPCLMCPPRREGQELDVYCHGHKYDSGIGLERWEAGQIHDLDFYGDIKLPAFYAADDVDLLVAEKDEEISNLKRSIEDALQLDGTCTTLNQLVGCMFDYRYTTDKKIKKMQKTIDLLRAYVNLISEED